MTATPKQRSRAEIYREAAMILEKNLHPQEVGLWSCLAIAKAAKPDYTGNTLKDGFYYANLRVVKDYEDTFLIYDNFGMDHDNKSRQHRIVALCMMAAMVERP